MSIIDIVLGTKYFDMILGGIYYEKNTIKKLIAGALVFRSVLSINTFNANVAQKGWVNLDGCWKYYDESGNEVKGKTITIEDKKFSFDNNGILIADQGEEIEYNSFL